MSDSPETQMYQKGALSARLPCRMILEVYSACHAHIASQPVRCRLRVTHDGHAAARPVEFFGRAPHSCEKLDLTALCRSRGGPSRVRLRSGHSAGPRGSPTITAICRVVAMVVTGVTHT